MLPTVPFWVLQRQVKVEEAGPETLRLTAPNLPPYELVLRPIESSPNLSAALYRINGDKLLITQRETDYDNPNQAWNVAFELYRQYVIV